MIGVRTGAVSGLVVVDLDPKHGGIENFTTLGNGVLLLPGQTASRTGSGGIHLYFEHPGPRIRNSASVLAPGVDVRGDGGYAAAPPSVLASGKRYSWITPAARPVPLPEWLANLLVGSDREQDTNPRACEMPGNPPLTGWETADASSAKRYAAGLLQEQCERLAAAQRGERNSVLFQVSARLGELVAGGVLDRGEATAVIYEAAQRCGLSPREVRSSLVSGFRHGAEQPRTAAQIAPTVDPSGCVDLTQDPEVVDLT